MYVLAEADNGTHIYTVKQSTKVTNIFVDTTANQNLQQ